MATSLAARYISSVAVMLLLVPAYAQQRAPRIELVNQPCAGKTAAKIGVFFSGVTELNGKPVSLPELGKALKDKSKVTEVCYHRERPDSQEAPPQTEQVLNAIIQERLPVAFYWDAQFQKRVSFKK